MKDKVLTLIIGILIGAILTAGGFLVYNEVNKKTSYNQMKGMHEMRKGERPEIPNDEQIQNGDSPEPSDERIPNGELPQSNTNLIPDEEKTQSNETTQNNTQKNKKNKVNKTETNVESNQNSNSESNA